MAEERARPVATRNELYSVASSLCVLLFMVLLASGKAEDHWFRIVAMFFVVGMQIMYVVTALLSMQKGRGKGSDKMA